MTQDAVAENQKSMTLIALGSNLMRGDVGSAETVAEAIAALRQSASGVRVSRFYATPCFPKGAGPDFVNAAIVGYFDMTAHETLRLCHKVEARLGRQRSTRWAGRVIDIDLIAVGGQIAPNVDTQTLWRRLPLSEQMRKAPTGLILPHPRLQDRAFVLGPLRDIAPDWQHPICDQSIAQMWDRLPKGERDAIVPL